MVNYPEQYKEICEQFVTEYFNRRKWQIENNFLVAIPLETYATIQDSPFAHQVNEIARAAAGLIKDDEEGWNRGVVYEGIQDLIEQLFAPPGLFNSYDIPDLFWEHPFGQMVSLAWIWVKKDQLITQKEAAEIRGVGISAISEAVKKGKLKGYRNPDAPNPQKGRVLVSKAEVEAMD